MLPKRYSTLLRLRWTLAPGQALLRVDAANRVMAVQQKVHGVFKAQLVHPRFCTSSAIVRFVSMPHVLQTYRMSTRRSVTNARSCGSIGRWQPGH